MVQNGMVWHIQDTAIIFHGCRPIQDGFTEKERESWRGSKLVNAFSSTLIVLRVFRYVDIVEILRDLFPPKDWLDWRLSFNDMWLTN